jgi:hypothetical protein
MDSREDYPMMDKKPVFFLVVIVLISVLSGCGGADKDKVEAPADDELTERVEESAAGKGEVYENARVVKLSIPFRTGPSDDAPVVEGRSAVFYGTYLDILDDDGDWLDVRHRSGDTGWILSRDGENTYAYRSGEYYANMTSSDEFLGKWYNDIREWAPDARLGLLFGEIANLDGLAVDWTALFFAESKPGKKLYIDEKGVRELSMEEDIPFNYAGEKADLVPYYTWYPTYTGPPDPVSSNEVCAPANVAAFVSSWPVQSNRDVIERRYATIYMILSETYWLIEFYQAQDSVITGTFDPATGKFLDASGSLIYRDAPAPAF